MRFRRSCVTKFFYFLTWIVKNLEQKDVEKILRKVLSTTISQIPRQKLQSFKRTKDLTSLNHSRALTTFVFHRIYPACRH